MGDFTGSVTIPTSNGRLPAAAEFLVKFRVNAGCEHLAPPLICREISGADKGRAYFARRKQGDPCRTAKIATD